MLIQIFMTIAGVCYVGAALAYILVEGKSWAGVTMLLYGCSIFTIYMASR